ncbi:hypothetical protein Tco_0606302 [Tanacetum coccineum]
MIEFEKPLKKKDQIIYDQEVALNLQAQLQAELEEEERLARQKEEEANIALIESWDNTQAMMDADRLLAERLQAREQEELTDEEKARLFVELLEKRKKHFAALRAQEKRNKPPTKAQKKSTMSTYLKHMAGYKQSQLKNKSFAEIQKLFDKAMTRVNMFVDMDTELVRESSKKDEAEMAQESSSKRAGDELEQEKAKKQKIDDDQEEAKLKELMEVISDEEGVAIDAIPLSTKPPSIVDYKIIKEGKINIYQIIRADGSSKRYSTVIHMLKDFDIEDLETQWKIVKARHRYTRPEEGYERVIGGDLKTIFEHHVEDLVWRRIVGIKRLHDDLRVTAAQLVLLVQSYNCLFRVNAAGTKLQLLKGSTTPISLPLDIKVARLLAIPTPPPSPHSPLSSPLPHILSPPLPVSPPPLLASPTYSLGYRAIMIQLRAESPSTSHPLPLPSPIVLLDTSASVTMMRVAAPSTYILASRSETPPLGTPPLLPIPLPTPSPPLLLPSTNYRAGDTVDPNE